VEQRPVRETDRNSASQEISHSIEPKSSLPSETDELYYRVPQKQRKEKRTWYTYRFLITFNAKVAFSLSTP
jgi:hypothetical protein